MPSPNHAGVSHDDDYDSDSSNFAPYANSVFFDVSKLNDPTGLLPEKIILGVNKRGVKLNIRTTFMHLIIMCAFLYMRIFVQLQIHFFSPVPKECLLSVELRDLMQFGSKDTSVLFRMRVAGVLRIFQFETKQV